MKVATIILAALSALLLLCDLLCGLWMRSKGSDDAGKRFHTRLGIAVVISGLATAALAIAAVA